MYLTIFLLGFIAYQNRNSGRMIMNILNMLRGMSREQLSNLYNTLTTAGHQYLASYFDRTSFEPSHSGNGSILSYFVSSKPYKILVRRPQTSHFIVITDIMADHQDVQDKITPFMGPYMDFYGILYTPKDFGHKHMMFSYIKNGLSISKGFAENEHIIL